MARKSLRFLRGKSIDGKVKLFIERGYPLYNNDKPVLNFKIYRKKEEDFVQGNDYYEYFDSIDYKKADLIYNGPLEKQKKYYFVYTDSDVKPLDVYSYWAKYEDDSVPVGPVGIAVRDPDVWWSFKKINSRMQVIYDKYRGKKQLKKFGYSTRKKELKGLILGNTDKIIGLMGVIHAGESGPELFLKAAERIVNERPDILEKVGLAIMPSVNADCREDMATGTPQYLRCNPNGVDINRNFNANWDTVDYTYGLNTSIHGSITYRGPFPQSEDETKAAVSFIDNIKPTVIFCGHCLSSICSDSFLTAKDAKKDEKYKNRCIKLITPYSKGFRNIEKEGINFNYGCTAGSIPAYAYKKHGIPAFDMEFRAVKDDKRERECVYGRTTVKLLDEFINYHYHGILNVMEALT